MKKYKILYCDPPWSYKTWTVKGGHKSASAHYKTMTLQDICELNISKISAKNSVLFMWATYPNLPEAFEVIKAWGYEYKTVAFTWVKIYDNRTPVLGLGYWTRANAEICLLATKGKDYPRRISENVSQVIISKLGEHSAKPDIVRNKIVELMGDLPRIELFARGNKEKDLLGYNKFEGWDLFGNECPSDVEIKPLDKSGDI